jgi:hypothetical protein
MQTSALLGAESWVSCYGPCGVRSNLFPYLLLQCTTTDTRILTKAIWARSLITHLGQIIQYLNAHGTPRTFAISSSLLGLP